MTAPEPTELEAQKIGAAHEAIKDRYGRVNWGSQTKPMREVWALALAEGVIDQEAHDLTRRDSGDFWDMTKDGPL